MNLPTELTQAIKMPWTAKLPSWVKLKDATIQKVIPLEIPEQTPNPHVCSNCSGAGWVYAFLVIGGPNPHVYSGANIASKWIDDAWHYGFMNAYPCPDCSGESMDHVLSHEPARETEKADKATDDWTI